MSTRHRHISHTCAICVLDLGGLDAGALDHLGVALREEGVGVGVAEEPLGIGEGALELRDCLLQAPCVQIGGGQVVTRDLGVRVVVAKQIWW